uniref:Uncharacterized protein n=1 Tax=Meloidogyne enterolobii TaxID=390850 RepID=A0A6V7U1I9_MELEN|nr:unnamed protein product [Meloidogyne enterolobii]
MLNSTCGIISSYVDKNPDNRFNLQMVGHFSWSSTSYLFIIKQNS